MQIRSVTVGVGLLAAVFFAMSSAAPEKEVQPRMVKAPEGQIPSDAVVLFDGTDLSEWTYTDGRPAGWTVSDGTMTVKDGSIITKKEFGNIQLHLEFATPEDATGEGQDRGNSGVYIQGAYEVQILDSYGNETYIDGMCGAIYGQYPPLVNASRPPGRWQVYDIVFHAPGFDSEGKVIKKAAITVFHNGVLIQDHVEIKPTAYGLRETESPLGPIYLQDHNHPVKYRNIWVREL